MALSVDDLRAIKRLVYEAIDERVPLIINDLVPKIIDHQVPTLITGQVQPMLDRLEKRLVVKIDQLTLDVGQFSLETTHNFMVVNGRLDDLDDGLATISEMTDNSRVELRKLKHRLGPA